MDEEVGARVGQGTQNGVFKDLDMLRQNVDNYEFQQALSVLDNFQATGGDMIALIDLKRSLMEYDQQVLL